VNTGNVQTIVNLLLLTEVNFILPEVGLFSTFSAPSSSLRNPGVFKNRLQLNTNLQFLAVFKISDYKKGSLKMTETFLLLLQHVCIHSLKQMNFASEEPVGCIRQKKRSTKNC